MTARPNAVPGSNSGADRPRTLTSTPPPQGPSVAVMSAGAVIEVLKATWYASAFVLGPQWYPFIGP